MQRKRAHKGSEKSDAKADKADTTARCCPMARLRWQAHA
jgi:hypothetical protein